MIDRRIGKIKVRRGTDSQRKLITFEEGELVYSTDKKRLYIGNGMEKGGILVSNRNYVKNSLGVPPVVPAEAQHGDIVYDKSNSKTYITKWNGSFYELILIASANCGSTLQNQINDLNNRLEAVSGCASQPQPPPPKPTNLSWFIEPSDISINLGQTATFTASAIGGFGPITYKWNRRDGVTISAVDNQSTLTIVTELSDIATYYCVANTFSENITSQNAVLNIAANSILAEDGTYILSELNEFIDWENNGLVGPTITVQPRSLITTTLIPVTFEVTATGSVPLSYQWRINGVNIPGETSRTYTVTNPTKDITGITCVVSNLVGSVVSNSVNLTVGVIPSITTQPVSQSVTTGSSVTFSVVAAGSTPLSYQWSKDGVVIIGATSSTYTINAAQTIDKGNYNCIVSNNYGNITSNIGILNVIDIFSEDIIISKDTQNFILKNELIRIGWNETSPVRVNVIVNSGVTVGSNSSTIPSFKVDGLPANSILNLINNGTIAGKGGDGGEKLENGYVGGNAIDVLHYINITNNGIIGGGGGGGGGDGIRGGNFGVDRTFGTVNGVGGNGYGYFPERYLVIKGKTIVQESEGTGGSLGETGKIGSGFFNVGSGGSAGYYIDGISFVTWIKQGDVRGRVK